MERGNEQIQTQSQFGNRSGGTNASNQHEWPSLQWTAGAAIPTRAILKKWWDSRARLFSAVGPHNATSKLLSSVPQRKPKSSKSHDSHPPMLGLLDAVQMQISESRQPVTPLDSWHTAAAMTPSRRTFPWQSVGLVLVTSNAEV